MFAGGVFFTPGQEVREFSVFSPSTRKTANGREVTNGYEERGRIEGILAQAKPSEIERWRQLEHPVTHKIIQQGASEFQIKAGDCLEESGGRKFYLQTAPYDPGGIGHWTIYYCEERGDIK